MLRWTQSYLGAGKDHALVPKHSEWDFRLVFSNCLGSCFQTYLRKATGLYTSDVKLRRLLLQNLWSCCFCPEVLFHFCQGVQMALTTLQECGIHHSAPVVDCLSPPGQRLRQAECGERWRHWFHLLAESGLCFCLQRGNVWDIPYHYML